MLRSKEEYHRLDEERQTDPSRFQPHGPLGNIQTFQGDFICHIAILADFTTSGTIYDSSDSTDILTSDTSAIEAAAGALLGIHHWNTRNTSVIKELEDVVRNQKLDFESRVKSLEDKVYIEKNNLNGIVRKHKPILSTVRVPL